MCGILAIFGSSLNEFDLRKKLIEKKCAVELRHRGPDCWSGYHVAPGVGMAHERLAIIDPDSGAQPLYSKDHSVVVAANGEVYNYKELYDGLTTPYTPLTGSDCEVVVPLYLQNGIEGFPNLLRGMFSFIIYDRRDDSYYAVRDHVGITPLYLGYGTDGSVWFASEMKALSENCARFEPFPPGHFFSSKLEGDKLRRWFEPLWRQPGHAPTAPYDKLLLRTAFEDAVKRRMMSDVPWGVLLSGRSKAGVVPHSGR